MTIEVLNVNKNYEGKPYLKNVSLDISSGSVISVAGAKKSGKTALLRIIMGLEEADDGQVNLLGDYKYDRFNIGAVFQDDRLCPGFTAAQNVAMVNKRLSVKVAGEELEKLLPAGTADLPVEDLTPAQRRMVCIIRACIIPSDVRLMDEPDLSPCLTPFRIRPDSSRFSSTVVWTAYYILPCLFLRISNVSSILITTFPS